MIQVPDDVDRIMAVMHAAFPPDFGEAWTRRQVEDALLVGNCHYRLIAATGAEPMDQEPAAGFFLSRHGFEEEELLLIAVDPEHRRKGIANKLLNLLDKDAISRGSRRIFLEMRQGNPAEILYLRHGFSSIGVRVNYYRTLSYERLDAITFCKQLDYSHQ